MFVKDSARRWIIDVVEYTFKQVIAGLYRRFIHDASLHKVVDQYEAVTYSRAQGVEGMFNNLKNFALRLPTPPDTYTFKKRIMLLLPEGISKILTTIHQLTAERSTTLTDIMNTAIAIERDEAASDYYSEARRKLEKNRRNSAVSVISGIIDGTTHPNTYKWLKDAVTQFVPTLNASMTAPSLSR
ncbi:hypothetical protein L218DRAFT_1010703 [Marasmius fiardii PR-910]|nr:hypothetical protein L218DRAFT_1010703 [Marasmius fiardii PR-910]